MQAFFDIMTMIYNCFDSVNVPGLNISIMQLAISMVCIAVAVGILIKIAPAGINLISDSYVSARAHMNIKDEKGNDN